MEELKQKFQRTVPTDIVILKDTPEIIQYLKNFGFSVVVEQSEPGKKLLVINNAIKVAEGTGFAPATQDIIGSELLAKEYMPVNTPEERMAFEIEELVGRIAKLDAFMKSDKFFTLDSETIGLLEAQFGAMVAYNHVLQLRLAKMINNNQNGNKDKSQAGEQSEDK